VKPALKISSNVSAIKGILLQVLQHVPVQYYKINNCFYFSPYGQLRFDHCHIQINAIMLLPFFLKVTKNVVFVCQQIHLNINFRLN